MTELDRLAKAALPELYAAGPITARIHVRAILTHLRDEPSEGAGEAALQAVLNGQDSIAAYIDHILTEGGQ